MMFEFIVLVFNNNDVCLLFLNKAFNKVFLIKHYFVWFYFTFQKEYEGSELYYYYYYYYTQINKRALAMWFCTRVEWLSFSPFIYAVSAWGTSSGSVLEAQFCFNGNRHRVKKRWANTHKLS